MRNLLRIDFFKLGLNQPTVDTRFRLMYNSFFHALEELGCCVTYCESKPNKDANVLVVPLGDGQDKSSALAMGVFGGPIILYSSPAAEWFRRGFLNRWRDRILFAYGFDVSEFSASMYARLGIPYYHLPFASTPSVMRPLGLQKMYDVAFVGSAGSGTGRHSYIGPLMRAIRSRKVLLIGPGWEAYGFPPQFIAWGDLLNIVYNVTHICINISNDEEKIGPDRRLDANNRLFDLAMAGCFQISNAPQVVRCYFDETEVVAVDPPDEWVAKIMYYLDHPSETEVFCVAARSRALAEHTWQHRAKQFLKMIQNHLPAWQESRTKTSQWVKIARQCDTILSPYGVHKAISKLQRKLKRRLCRS